MDNVQAGSSHGSAQAQAVSVANPIAATPNLASSWTDALFRSWTTEFGGHHIHIERRGLLIRLYVDKVLRDSRFTLPGRDAQLPILSAHLTGTRSEVVMVEAYLTGLRLKIMARGRAIGGDAV